MKAYYAYLDGEEWGTIIHGATRGKAKARFLTCSPMILSRAEFVYIRLYRIPGLDNKPITYQNAASAGFYYNDEDGKPITENEFINDCNCEICRKGNK